MTTFSGSHSGYNVNVTAPLMVPGCRGVNVIPSVQLVPGPTPGVGPQGFVPAGTRLNSPLTAMGISDNPLRSMSLLTCTTLAALVVPIACGAKVTEAGVNVTSGRMLADRGTTLGLDWSLSAIISEPAAAAGSGASSFELCTTWMLQ